MADVLIVCVREDELQAKALADMFERAGFSVGGAPANDGVLRSTGAGVIVWSQASIRSRPFLDAAQRVIDVEKAVVASLIDPPPPHTVGNAPSFALNGWTGDPEDPSLDPLFFAVDRMVSSQRAAVGAPAARPAQDRFEEPPSLRPPPAAYTPRAPRPEPAPRPSHFESRPPQRAPESPPAPRDPLSAESEHWRAIRDSRNPADFMDYLGRYGPNGAFSEVAELKLKQLTGPGAPPANLRDAARAAEPARARRPDPPPPPRRPEPPRREPSYARDYNRPPPDDAPRNGGGLMRVLILVLLLGGGALAAGIYFGDNGALQAANEDAATTADEQLDQPSPGPAELGVGGAENPDEPVELASIEPPPAARREPPQREQLQREQAPREQARPAVVDDAPPPPPQTSWSGPPPSTSLAASAGPVPLAPDANPPPAPQQFAANTVIARPPTARPAGTVVWAQRPTARRIAETYPSRAAREGIGGRAELDCTVRADLSLACGIASETPAGSGFGRAALAASNIYRVRPTLTDGAAAAGARTRIAITFQPPQD